MTEVDGEVVVCVVGVRGGGLVVVWVVVVVVVV